MEYRTYMTQINGNQGVNTNYYNQGPNQAQQAPNATGVNSNYRPDQFQQPNKPQSGIAGLLGGGEKKPYVTKQSVMTGLAGAAAGFMIGGPVGAVIGGLIGLLLSVIMNIMKMSKDAKNPVPQQPMQIYPNQQQGASSNQSYQQRMQQQQAQQANQQIQQNGQGQQPGPQQYFPGGGR